MTTLRTILPSSFAPAPLIGERSRGYDGAAAARDRAPKWGASHAPTAVWTFAEPLVKALIVSGVLLIAAWGFLGGASGVELAHAPRGERIFWWIAGPYAILTAVAMVWRIGLWLRYRPMAAVDDARLPSVTVIVPAYNEGRLVKDAILAAAANDYPIDRLEIIAIDDGSTDDTWQQIRAAAAEIGERVRIRVLRQPQNEGKRRALYRAFTEARGDVFVTIDSDSILAADALRHAVSPLVRDPRIGCVAGCVRVLNPRQSMMTRFLKCYFSLSFDFVRAYQSAFRGVFCTPGALSVYRADAARGLADEWLNQRFLGRTCTTGEDRAMTNLFLREGWQTAYQGSAVVHCKMPHTYVDVVRMFLRWARSNIRETIFLYRFLFKPFRERHLAAFRVNMVLVLLALVLPPILIAQSLTLASLGEICSLHRLALVFAFASIMAAIYYRNERDSDWVYLLLYKLFWVLCLSWVLPYAALTLHNTKWLTRGKSDSSGTEPRDAFEAPLMPASEPACI